MIGRVHVALSVACLCVGCATPQVAIDHANNGVRLTQGLHEELVRYNEFMKASAERRIAARTVINRLVRAGAIGAVSTHDLQLGAEAELRDLAVRIHFTETVRTDNGKPVMTFDYRIRPGDATSTNALVLLELMGLR